jgi:hypothetical protein
LVSLKLSFYKFSNPNRLDLGAKELRSQKTGKNMRRDSVSFLSKDYSRALMTSTTPEE